MPKFIKPAIYLKDCLEMGRLIVNDCKHCGKGTARCTVVGGECNPKLRACMKLREIKPPEGDSIE